MLTDEQRVVVDSHLRSHYPTFWRFTQLFFHSGGRIRELLSLQAKDINLKQQEYVTLVKKGKYHRWVKRPIKDIVVSLWQELLEGAHPDYYVFSENLEPGSKKIRDEQITRRWNTHVKRKLGIHSDFYKLKHLNTTEVVDALSEEEAAKLNAHTSTAMVIGIYDVKNKDRKFSRIKQLQNSFAPNVMQTTLYTKNQSSN